jgi:cytoskeletal protein CcmA (bactofilin family)
MIKGREEENKINAFLGKNTNFNGTLIFEGLLRVDGIFDGNIKTNDTLVLADSSKVKADIEAGIVKISGNFNGNIIAKEKVELFKPANISGTIHAPVVAMEEGVIFNGSLEMTKAKANLKEVKGEIE